MNFNPISISPEQKRSTTPDVFITDQYGKLPDLNGDGPLTINEAVRLSKIVNGYAPAFTGGLKNKIISGFMIDESCVKFENEKDLVVRLPPGTAIIDGIIFKTHLYIEARWDNFLNSVPPNLAEGKILIYFEYEDVVTNYEDRPLPQSYTREPTVAIPKNQVGFNPIKLCHAFYDPEIKDVVNSSWNEESNVILISSNISYKKNEDGTLKIEVNDEDTNPVVIKGEEYKPEGGGNPSVIEVDGGALDEIDPDGVNKPFKGINVSINESVDDPYEPIELVYPLSSDSGVFFNGILYYPDVDYKLNETQILFQDDILTPGKQIFAFENLKKSDFGYMSMKYSGISRVNAKKIIINGVTSNGKYLVFLNGLLQTEYTVGTNYISMSVKAGEWVIVYEVFEGKNISFVYSGDAPNSSIFRAFNLTTSRNYLVFYNGVLYLENLDFRLLPNTIIMNFAMKATKNLTVIGV